MGAPRKATLARGGQTQSHGLPFRGGSKATQREMRTETSHSDHPLPDNRAQGSETVRVWLLGGFQVSVGSRTIDAGQWRLKKAAVLVKLLALASGHRMHREQAMDLLWPDSGRRAASNSLRQALYAARKTLDPTAGSRYLAGEEESLVLCPEDDLWVDVVLAATEALPSADRSGILSGNSLGVYAARG